MNFKESKDILKLVGSWSGGMAQPVSEWSAFDHNPGWNRLRHHTSVETAPPHGGGTRAANKTPNPAFTCRDGPVAWNFRWMATGTVQKESSEPSKMLSCKTLNASFGS